MEKHWKWNKSEISQRNQPEAMVGLEALIFFLSFLKNIRLERMAVNIFPRFSVTWFYMHSFSVVFVVYGSAWSYVMFHAYNWSLFYTSLYWLLQCRHSCRHTRPASAPAKAVNNSFLWLHCLLSSGDNCVSYRDRLPRIMCRKCKFSHKDQCGIVKAVNEVVSTYTVT